MPDPSPWSRSGAHASLRAWWPAAGSRLRQGYGGQVVTAKPLFPYENPTVLRYV